jgi:hypothetical protein
MQDQSTSWIQEHLNWIQNRRRARWYDRRAMVLVAFLVGLAASAIGGAVAVTRGLALWRQTKRTGGALARELSSFDEGAARTERHLAEWERASAELDLALERLRVSRARLSVLQDAVEHAQGRVRWLRVFLPTR